MLIIKIAASNNYYKESGKIIENRKEINRRKVHMQRPQINKFSSEHLIFQQLLSYIKE